MPQRQKISDDELRAAAQAGLTQIETARRYGVGDNTVSRRAAQAGIEFPPGRLGPNERVDSLTDEQRADIQILVVQGGYSNVSSRELVLRPKAKVRAAPPYVKPQGRPVSGFSASPTAIARHLEQSRAD